MVATPSAPPPQTMTEKILARASGRPFVRPGDDIEARPDFVISYDFPGYTDVFFRESREDLGVERIAPRGIAKRDGGDPTRAIEPRERVRSSVGVSLHDASVTTSGRSAKAARAQCQGDPRILIGADCREPASRWRRIGPIAATGGVATRFRARP